MTWLINPYRFTAPLPLAAECAYWRVDFHGSNGDAVWIAEAEMAASIGGADLCNTGNGTASSGADIAPFSTTSLFDNNVATLTLGKWPDRSWLQWQFPAAQGVAEVRLRGPTAAQIANQALGLTVRGSTNGTDWNVYAIHTGLTWVADETKSFAVGAEALPMTGSRNGARAWRLNVTENQGGSVVQVGELIFAASSGGGGLSSAGYVSSGGFYAFGRVATSAFDGNTTSQWSTPTTNDHGRIGAVLAAQSDVQEVRICRGNAADANGAPYDFTVEWSEDVVNWNVAATFTAVTGWSAGVYKTFAIP